MVSVGFQKQKTKSIFDSFTLTILRFFKITHTKMVFSFTTTTHPAATTTTTATTTTATTTATTATTTFTTIAN